MARNVDVLVAHSYYLRHDAKQVEKMKPYPPLATLLAAAVLRERGHRTALFDAMLAPGVEAFEAALDDAAPRVVGIVEDNFNFLTKMCTLRNREAALAMVRLAKSRGCRVAVNGSDASDQPWLYLAAGADAVILGEAEGAFAELVGRWLADADAPIDDVAGLVLPPAGGGVPGRGRVRHTRPRPFLEDLDALPLPAWDLVDVEAYRSAWLGAHGRFSWNMVTSRGCPYGCNWCAKPVFGRRYAQRSPAGVAEELRRLKDDVAPDHVWFADDIFGLTPGWIHAFAAEVTARGARTPFMIQSRVNLMKPETVAALVEAGAEEVWLGVESGSQKVLDAMEKGTRVEQVRTATRALKSHGVRVGWFLQLGYPGEEWEDIERTRDLVLAERPDEVGVSVAYPLPGTKFHDRVRAQLGAKQNWTESDDLAMLFHGTYVTPFYKRIRDALHELVRPGASEAEAEARWAELAREEAAQRAAALAGAAG
ncbi:MAG: B12-binding domain-containing radical SAM protein [Gemmatimonadetes bacterium]|nr:B12-binding domain-containing radical SAM protein [Gemmatimonadota bacterium]